MIVDNHIHLFQQSYTLETIEKIVAAARSRSVEEVGIVEHGTEFRSWRDKLDDWWTGRCDSEVAEYYQNTFWPTQGTKSVIK